MIHWYKGKGLPELLPFVCWSPFREQVLVRAVLSPPQWYLPGERFEMVRQQENRDTGKLLTPTAFHFTSGKIFTKLYQLAVVSRISKKHTLAVSNKKNKRRPTKSPRGKVSRRLWAKWSSARLLDLRMCDLDLSIKGSVLEERINQVYYELERHDLCFRPYFWLSDDWFTPDGCTGIAIPFYLAHPRLMQLERNQLGEVEGGTRQWCMKLLRHEVGHTLDHAFKLHRRRKWQRLFGSSSHKYPRTYRPNPYSRRYVQHLEYWYAQSHPDEDFAETFAVWLQPNSRWKKRYRGWPAMKKLEYVDELMAEIAGTHPLVRTRTRVDSLATLRKTLREHYQQKKTVYAKDYTDVYDADLRQLFTDRRGFIPREAASSFIRRIRPHIYQLTSCWIGEYHYLLDHVIKSMIGRCRDLKLYVKGPERRIMIKFIILLTKHTMDSLYRNRYWVEM